MNVGTIYDSQLYDYLDHNTEDQYFQHSLNNCLINWIVWGDCKHFFLNSLTIAKLTMATKLAIITEKVKPKVTLPSEYANYAQVFSKEVINHIPLSHLYDHEINLYELFMSKIGKIYALSLDEKKSHWRLPWQKPSCWKDLSFQLSSSISLFFVKKKDGRIHPCQDY